MKMKEIIFILLFSPLISLGQNNVYFGGTSGNDTARTPNNIRIDKTVKLPYYSPSIGTVPLIIKNNGVVDTGRLFTDTQADRLKDLVYINHSYTLNTSPTYGERAVMTNYNVQYSVSSGDDDIDSVGLTTFGNVTSDVGGGVITKQDSSKVNKTYTLYVKYDRKDTLHTVSYTYTFNAYTPQWTGVSPDSSITTYAEASTLNKYIQLSTAITRTDYSPTDEYVWFISNNSDALIRDGNDFSQTIGAWGNNTTEFWMRPYTLILADGSSSVTVYMYRSRLAKTFSDITYKIQ